MRNGDVLPLLAELLDIAESGLQKRGLGEEIFLLPLQERLAARRSPADRAVALFQEGGVSKLLKILSIYN
jgi:hypothetical protein